MNNINNLQDVMFLSDNQNGPVVPNSRNKKPKTSSNQLQLHVASVYQDLYQLLSQKKLEVSLPQQVPTAIQRVSLIKSLIQFFLESSSSKQTKQQKTLNKSDQQIQCTQCANYQANLQKLENQVRQHIRVQQQLKLYTDNIEEKLQETKKQKNGYEKKLETYKRQIQELKSFSTSSIQRLKSVEQQNQKLKSEIKIYKVSRGDDTKRSNKGVQNKENNYGHRNINIKRQEKLDSRRSVQKRQQSAQKFRNSVNARSTKGFPISEKLISQKNKQERKRILQSKFQFRR